MKMHIEIMQLQKETLKSQKKQTHIDPTLVIKKIYFYNLDNEALNTLTQNFVI